MIYHAKVPLKFWAEAVNTAIYLRNRSPISALKDKTSFECWFGEKSDVSNLRVFGCICFVHMPDNLRKELDPKSTKALFVGYIPYVRKAIKVMTCHPNPLLEAEMCCFRNRSFMILNLMMRKLCFVKYMEVILITLNSQSAVLKLNPLFLKMCPNRR